jgi:hypothetical protein
MITEKRREQCRVNTARWRTRSPLAPGVAAAKFAAWHRANPEKSLLQNAKRRARRKGIPFDLVYTDIQPLPTYCPVLGLKLAYGPGRGRDLYKNPNAASLDRIYNDRGYVKGNVIVVSLRANLLKGQATVRELRRIADFYERLV